MSNSLWPHGLQHPGFLVLHHLPEFAPTPVHWVRNAHRNSAASFPQVNCFLFCPEIASRQAQWIIAVFNILSLPLDCVLFKGRKWAIFFLIFSSVSLECLACTRYSDTYSGLGVQVPHFYRQNSSNELLSGCPNAAPQDPEGKGRQDSLEHRTPSTNHLCSSMICEADMSWFYFLSVDPVTMRPNPRTQWHRKTADVLSPSRETRYRRPWGHLALQLSIIYTSHPSPLQGQNNLRVNLSKAFQMVNQMTVWKVNSRGLLSNMSMKSRWPPSPPSRSKQGSRPCTPSVRLQREAGLYGWGQGFSCHSLNLQHSQVTSFLPLVFSLRANIWGPCPPRRTGHILLVHPECRGRAPS